MWIRGKPGSGKSTLAKDIVVKLRSKDTFVIIGAWFYSVKLDSTYRSHQSLLRALLGNFLEQDESLFREHVQIYREARLRQHVSWAWQRHHLEDYLRAISLTSRESDIVAVIDALDESEDEGEINKSRDHLATFLLDIAEHPLSCMRFIVLSRPYKSLQTMFRNCEQIVLEQENEEDLKEVVERELNWLRHAINQERDQESVDVESERPGRRRRRKRSRDVVATANVIHADPAFAALLDAQFQDMRDYLIQNAKGVFLWVTLVLKELHQISKSGFPEIMDLNQTLHSLPSELEDLYVFIADRLQKSGLKKARRILDWIIGSSQSRALTLSMLFEAMSIDEGINVAASVTPTTDPFLIHKSILRRRSWGAFAFDVYEQCGGLVDVVPPNESRKRFQEYHEEEINDQWVAVLLHRTCLDFIASTRCPGALRTDGLIARSVVENGLVTYVQVYLPMEPGQNPTFHPHLTIEGDSIYDETRLLAFSSACVPLQAEQAAHRADDRSEPIPHVSTRSKGNPEAEYLLDSTPKKHIITTDCCDEDRGDLFKNCMRQSKTYNVIHDEHPYQGIGAHLQEDECNAFWTFEVTKRLNDGLSNARRSRFPATAKFVNQLFSEPDMLALRYFEERRLLSFGLEILPQLWDMAGYQVKLRSYKLLATRPLSALVPAWFRWLQDIPGNILLAACEHDCPIALANLKTLAAFSPVLRGMDVPARAGALMLFCSQYGPTSNVPVMVDIYFRGFALNYGGYLHDSSIIYDVVLACSHRYKDLGSYLTWRWLRKDLLLQTDRFPYFHTTSVSAKEPAKNANCVKLLSRFLN